MAYHLFRASSVRRCLHPTNCGRSPGIVAGVADNIVLIGMPGAGKSTVGVVLAKRLGMGFIDCDLVIQAQTGRRLAELIAG